MYIMKKISLLLCTLLVVMCVLPGCQTEEKTTELKDAPQNIVEASWKTKYMQPPEYSQNELTLSVSDMGYVFTKAGKIECYFLVTEAKKKYLDVIRKQSKDISQNAKKMNFDEYYKMITRKVVCFERDENEWVVNSKKSLSKLDGKYEDGDVFIDSKEVTHISLRFQEFDSSSDIKAFKFSMYSYDGDKWNQNKEIVYDESDVAKAPVNMSVTEKGDYSLLTIEPKLYLYDPLTVKQREVEGVMISNQYSFGTNGIATFDNDLKNVITYNGIDFKKDRVIPVEGKYERSQLYSFKDDEENVFLLAGKTLYVASSDSDSFTKLTDVAMQELSNSETSRSWIRAVETTSDKILIWIYSQSAENDYETGTKLYLVEKTAS